MRKSPPVDVAILLGAMVNSDGSPSPAMVRRVRYGVDQLILGHAKNLILSGGSVGYKIPEAQIMRNLALEMGAKDSQLILEDKSINTIENIRFSVPLAADRGLKTIAVVTDAYHLPRALYICRRLGVVVQGWGVRPQSEKGQSIRWEWWLAYLREGVAMPRTIWRIEWRLWADRQREGTDRS